MINGYPTLFRGPALRTPLGEGHLFMHEPIERTATFGPGSLSTLNASGEGREEGEGPVSLRTSKKGKAGLAGEKMTTSLPF